jgi:hypothetical protein
MGEQAALQDRPGVRILLDIPKGQMVEFCPWIRTGSLETHLLVTDLVHTLGRQTGPVSDKWRRRLAVWAQKERVVDQLAADGTPLARFTKRLEEGEIWRLSFGTTAGSTPEYGLLVVTGPHVLCHFQLVGPRTFATCHSRRYPQMAPRLAHLRSIPVPNHPGYRLWLFLMNRGEGSNDITLSRTRGNGRGEATTVTLPPLGCRLVCLHRLFKTVGEGPACERVFVKSVYPYDLYTLIESGSGPDGALSIQHIK